ncbi:MAG: hypothetical protein KA248_01420 [Kiritimatiellae bacterium]|nr:hypothetical protein [Kiritimatiellia bacterium]
MNQSTTHPQYRRGASVVLAVLALMFVSRYLPSPRAVFVADDWFNYARSSFYATHGDAVRTALTDPNRPLSMAAVEIVYRVFGDRSGLWTALSLVSHSLMILCVMLMGWELTRSWRTAAIQGVLLVLLPNLTETWHWSTQILNQVTCAMLPYALSGWMGVAYVRRGGAWRAALSAVAYAVGLFSYEQGILLPAAGLTLLSDRRELRRVLTGLAPMGVIAVLYAAWRVTNSFGLNTFWGYPPQMTASASWTLPLWNLRQIMHWWMGDNLFGAWLDGLRGFAMLAPWTRRLLVMLGVAMLAAAGALLKRRAGEEEATDRAGVPPVRAAAFGLLWAAAAYTVCLIAYVDSRLNILPAFGLTLALAVGLNRWPIRQWGPVLFLPALLAMAANQGTTESFRQVGVFDRRIYQHLQQTQPEWKDQAAVLVDTRALRQRLTRGLLAPIGAEVHTWALYQNALLLRSMVPRGMVWRLVGEWNPPLLVVHDVENGARIEGDRLVWHDRGAPDVVHDAPLDRVYVLDVWAAAVGSK